MKDKRKKIIDALENKIKVDSKELVSYTSYYRAEGTINNKTFVVTMHISEDTECGVTDSELDILFGDSDDLTEEEQEEVLDYFRESIKW